MAAPRFPLPHGISVPEGHIITNRPACDSEEACTTLPHRLGGFLMGGSLPVSPGSVWLISPSQDVLKGSAPMHVCPDS